MVIISASICDKQGKILISRQFQNITKHSLEESVLNFPKLITSNQQHTFVENEQARYVYLPIDSLYLLLVTKKNSNILEDQETLRFLYKILQEVCNAGITEKNIQEKAFDILLAFDDVISLGYRESVSLSQVQNALEMDSSEEKLHQMLMVAKQNEANENIKQHQRDIEKKRAEQKKSGVLPGNTNSAMGKPLSSTNDVVHQVHAIVEKPVVQQLPTQNPTIFAPKKGMTLGKKKTVQTEESAPSKQDTTALEKQIIKEEIQQIVPFNPLKAAFELELIEKINCNLTRDGALNLYEVVGELFLQCLDVNKSKAQVSLNHVDVKGVTVKLHPNLNRQLWTQQKQLGMKEAGEGFPVNSTLSTLKYTYSNTSLSVCPFLFTYWYTDGSLTMEVEFNTQQTKFEKLENLQIELTFGGSERPMVKKVENGDFTLVQNQSKVKWLIAQLDSQQTLSNIEIIFSKECSIDSLFPLVVHFENKKTYIEFSVKEILNLNDQSSIKYDFSQKIVAEKFNIL